MDTDAKAMGRRKAFLYAHIFILLSLVIFFSRSLFTDRIPATADILQTCTFFQKKGLPAAIQNRNLLDLDNVDQFIPWFQFNTESIKSGSLPLWNPHEACGQPHIANMQSAFFFPLNYLIYLLGMKWGLLLIYLMRLYLCGIFVYLYLSQIHVDYRAAIVGAIAAMFTGYNTRWLYQANSSTAFFIPLGLWALELIVQHQDSIKGYIILCLGFALALFAGHPETLFYATTIVLLYAFIRILQTYKRTQARLRTFLKISAFLFIGMLIAGVQIIPFLEYLLHSTAFSIRATGSSHSLILLSTFLFSLVPNFLSSFLHIHVLYVVFFGLFPTSTVGYTGITMFFLGIAGLIALRRLNKQVMLPYLIILIYIMTVALNIPVLHKVISMLPIFKLGHYFYMFGNLPLFIIFSGTIVLDAYLKEAIESKYLLYAFLITISIIGIGFIFFFIQMGNDVRQPGVDRLSLSLPTLIDITGTLILLVLTLFMLKKIKTPALRAYSIGILIFVETALPMIPLESAIKPAYFYPVNPIIGTLDQQKKPFRILPLFKAHNNEVGPPWPIGIVQYYGFEEPTGYDAMLVHWYSQLIKTMPFHDFLNLANIKFIIMTKDDVPRFQGLGLKPMLSYNGYTLYKNRSALNRAFMVYDYKTVRMPSGSHKLDDRNWLDLVNENAGQLSTTAIIPEPDAQYTTFSPGKNAQGTFDVQFEVYKPSFIKMNVDTSGPGLLVISNTYFPGWHVYVDNEETRLIQTDYAFDGVFLEKGVHTVVLTYKPLSFLIGLILTITGIISLLLFSLALARKKEIA